MNILVDTNVLLDVIAKRKPFYTDSATIWTLAEQGQFKAYISAISFNNIYYIIEKLRSKTVARKAMVLLRDTYTVVDLDRKIIDQAIDSDFKDFEDGIQAFSAFRVSADFIVTRNIKHYKKSNIQAVSPNELLIYRKT